MGLSKSRSTLLHISAAIVGGLPSDHPNRRIWAELRRDFDRHIVVGQAPGCRPLVERDGKTVVVALPRPFAFGRIFVLSSLAALPIALLTRPRVVLAQSPLRGGLSAWLSAVFGKAALVTEVHGWEYFSERRSWSVRLRKCLSAFVFHRSTLVRVLCSRMSEALIEHYGVPPDLIAVVPTRVDTQAFASSANAVDLQPKREASAKRDFRVAMIGVAPRKQPLVALEAMRGLDCATLVLIGDDPHLAELREFTRAMNLSDRVEFAGWCGPERVVALLQSVDAYLLCSAGSTEGLPRAMLEAMACSLPVIVPELACIPDLVQDGRNGVLLRTVSADSIRRAIVDLSADLAAARLAGVINREMVEQQYRWDAGFDAHRAMLQQADRLNRLGFGGSGIGA